jgi:hypothetical protein
MTWIAVSASTSYFFDSVKEKATIVCPQITGNYHTATHHGPEGLNSIFGKPFCFY